MAHPELEPAYLHRVLVGTWIGLGAGVFALALLAGILPGRDFLNGSWDNLTVGVLLVLVMASLTLQIWVRLARGQRRLMAQLHVIRLQVLSAEQRMMHRQPVITTAYVGRSATSARSEVDTEPIEEEPKSAASVPPDDIDGLTPEMVELARRTSERLRGANGSK